MQKNKKNILLILILLVSFFVVSREFGYVKAEDEDDDQEELKEYENERTDSSSASDNRELAQTTSVSKSVETVVLKDSDGDGILDRDDAHPNVAEIYIVEDKNRNGIVDKFED